MKYVVEGSIMLPRQRVLELFTNPENMAAWQESLISYRHLEGVVGQNGAKTLLTHRLGRRHVEMVETIEWNELPALLSVVYEAKSAWNRVVYRFQEDGRAATRWQMDCEFRCRGILRLAAVLAPRMFQRSTERDMERFKSFAEAQPR